MAKLSTDELKKATKNSTVEKKPEKPAPKQYLANFPGLIDLCTDAKGYVVFLVKKDNTPVIQYDYVINNGRKVYPPPIALLPFKLPRSVNVIELIVNENQAHSPHKTRMNKGDGECGGERAKEGSTHSLESGNGGNGHYNAKGLQCKKCIRVSNCMLTPNQKGYCEIVA